MQTSKGCKVSDEIWVVAYFSDIFCNDRLLFHHFYPITVKPANNPNESATKTIIKIHNKLVNAKTKQSNSGFLFLD